MKYIQASRSILVSARKLLWQLFPNTTKDPEMFIQNAVLGRPTLQFRGEEFPEWLLLGSYEKSYLFHQSLRVCILTLDNIGWWAPFFKRPFPTCRRIQRGTLKSWLPLGLVSWVDQGSIAVSSLLYEKLHERIRRVKYNAKIQVAMTT